MESREHEVKPLMLQANIFPLLKLFGLKKNTSFIFDLVAERWL